MFYSIPPSFRFRPLTEADWMHVCRWFGEEAHQSEYWQWKIFRMLTDQSIKTRIPSRQDSWIAVTGRTRLFLLETAGEEIFLTAPIAVLQHTGNARLIWSAVIIHLLKVEKRKTFVVHLADDRQVEAAVLIELGFSCWHTAKGSTCKLIL